MRLTEMHFPDARPITGYGPGFFRIGEAVHEGPMVAGPRGLRPWGGLEDHAPLLAMAEEIDVLFIGTGVEIAQIPSVLRSAMEEANVGVEIMASPTACRSYNVLLSEGRRIALAALPV